VLRRRAGVAGGLMCVAAIGVAVAASRHASVSGVSPVDPRGDWRLAWIVAVVSALVCCGVGIWLALVGVLQLRAALLVAAVVQALPLLAPLLLSRDVDVYWADARVVTVHHASPYLVTPSRFPSDPATRVASVEWRTKPEPYGPAWVAVGTLPAFVAGSSRKVAEFGYRLVAVAGVLAAVLLLALFTRSAAAVALLGWNPLVALHYAGGGHSDALMTLFLLAAVLYGLRASGGVSWAVASMFKAVPLVFLPLELARSRLRRPLRFWVGLVGAAVVLTAVAFVAFGSQWVKGSLEGVHGTSPIGGVHFLAETGLRHRYAVVIGAAVFAVVYVLLVRSAWRNGKARLGFAAAAFCMCSSLLRPWYALWPLALASAEQDGLSVAAAFALSAYVLIADAIPT